MNEKAEGIIICVWKGSIKHHTGMIERRKKERKMVNSQDRDHKTRPERI